MPQAAASEACGISWGSWGPASRVKCRSCAWAAARRLARSRARRCSASSSVWYGPRSALGYHE
eukprot:837066-Lingulodinium_polyedra.AAC.1